MNKEKLIKQLFVGKASEVIGMEKTLELLTEATDVINAIPEKDREETIKIKPM